MSDFRSIIDEDARSHFTGDFADDVVVSDGGTVPISVSIRGIYNETYQQVDPETQTVVSSTKPSVTVWIADVPFRIKPGHLVTARGKTYRIRDPQRDGEGSVVLFLD